MVKKLYSFCFLFLFVCFFLAAGQEALQSQETESEVPELTAFHEIIYPIWHDAYPNKDYASLRNFVPKINSYAEKIYAAKLPGILRDKEAKWKEGLAEFKKAVDDYNAAASRTDDQALLNAAEALHAKYEMLVRTIRPVLKEIDEYHKILYVIYHKYLPDKNFEKIKAESSAMILKAEAISKATLPRRFESKAESFKAAAQELYEATKGLEAACQSDDKAAIEEAVNKVHTKYQSLVNLF